MTHLARRSPRRNGWYSFSNHSGLLLLKRGSKSVITGTISHFSACAKLPRF